MLTVTLYPERTSTLWELLFSMKFMQYAKQNNFALLSEIFAYFPFKILRVTEKSFQNSFLVLVF